MVIACAVKVQAAQTVELGNDSGRTLQGELESSLQISTDKAAPLKCLLQPGWGPPGCPPKAQVSEEML